MRKRWRLVAHPVGTGVFSETLAESWNDVSADAEFFWTERGARSAAEWHMRALPVLLVPERVQR